MTQLKTFKFIFVTIVLVVLFGFGAMYTNVTIYTIVDIEPEQIIEENDHYYLLFDDRKLKLSENARNHLELDKFPTYKLTYSYNKLLDKKGKVLRLEVYGKQIPQISKCIFTIK